VKNVVDKLIDIPSLSAFYMIYQYQPPLAISIEN